jgi:hypothetical protein
LGEFVEMRTALLLLLSCSALCANESIEAATYISDAVTTPIHHRPPGDYFWFCFATSEGVMVGETFVWSERYDPRVFDKVRQQTLALRVTANNIWVIRSDGKELKLKRDDSNQEFSEHCRKMAKKVGLK